MTKITEKELQVLNHVNNGGDVRDIKGGALLASSLVKKGLLEVKGTKKEEIIKVKEVNVYGAIQGVPWEIGTNAKPRVNKGNSENTEKILQVLRNAETALTAQDIADETQISAKSVNGSLLAIRRKNDVIVETILVNDKAVKTYKLA